MTPDIEEQLDSSSLWNLLYFYCNQIYFTLLSNLSLTSNFNYSSLPGFISFEEFPFNTFRNITYVRDLFPYDNFQLELLKLFCAILLTNLFLLFIAWQVYGKRICQRFMKPATPKVIEELKKSVSELKLPKQHSPRI